jgi:hypothetical protein
MLIVHLSVRAVASSCVLTSPLYIVPHAYVPVRGLITMSGG